jgi:nucleotide-binding universal stress UspA family protein
LLEETADFLQGRSSIEVLDRNCEDIVRILLAIDASEVSDVAVRAVAERPWPEGSVVRVLHVVQPLYPPPAAAWAVSVSPQSRDAWLHEAEQRLFEDARKLVRSAADALASTGLRTESETVLGDPRDGILAHAKDWEADLVVLGSHGRTGIKRWVLGSVAEAVVRHAPCSVQVVRARTA